MRQILFCFVLFLLQTAVFAQNAPQIFEKQPATTRYDIYAEDVVPLTLNLAMLREWQMSAPDKCNFEMPFGKTGKIVLALTSNSIFADGFKVVTGENEVVNYKKGLHYKGFVQGQPGSMVALSVFGNEVIGLITTTDGTFVLGSMPDAKGKPTENYVFYNERGLKLENKAKCGTGSLVQPVGFPQPFTPTNAEKNLGAPVDVYFTADYYTYQQKGNSVSNTANYIAGIFNQLAILYDSIEVSTQISEIYVYSTVDPYANIVTTGEVLTAYGNNLAGNFNGDLAHFVTTRNLGGGIAWIGGLCTTSYSYAVSGDLSDISTFPTFSWAVYVVSHEMGHNLNSPHTHDCAWGTTNDAQIDECGPSVGYGTADCADVGDVVSGGTIMSYCHLSGVGINFLKHFGPLPGAKISSYVVNSVCLSNVSLNCSTPVVLTCGGTYLGNTNTGLDSIDFYPCFGTNLEGKEKVHAFTITEPKKVTLIMTGTSTQQMMLLSNCNTASCLATNNDTIVIGELQAGTYYVVVDNTTNNVNGAYSLSLNCATPDICPSIGGTVDEFIQSFTFNAYTNTSGNNGGYANFNNAPPLAIAPGQVLNFSITPGYSAAVYPEYFMVWIDFNNNNVFNNDTELIFMSADASTQTVNGSFTLPTTGIATGVPLTMRVKMIYGNNAPVPCGTFVYGETEDYKVQIGSSCAVPTNLGFMAFAAGKGNLYWTKPASSGAVTYNLRYKKESVSTWTIVNQSLTYRQITGLDATSAYTFQVRSICGAGDTNVWSPSIAFQPSGLATCGKPTTSKALAISSTSQRIVWPFMSTATKYQIRYRTVGGAFTTLNANQAIASLTGLLQGTVYQYQIRAYCNNVWSAYSVLFEFTTPALLPAGLIDEGVVTNTAPVLYPNPASASFMIALPTDAPISVTLLSLEGRVVLEVPHYQGESIDIRGLAAGVYFVSLRADGESVPPQMLRLIKQ